MCASKSAHTGLRSESSGSWGHEVSSRLEEAYRSQGHILFDGAVSDSPSGAGWKTASWLPPDGQRLTWVRRGTAPVARRYFRCLPANYELRLIQLSLDFLIDGERCGFRVGCGRCRHMNIELIASGFAETKDGFARENQRRGVPAHRTTNELAPEHVSELMASLF